MHRTPEVKYDIDPPTPYPTPTAPLITSHVLELPISLRLGIRSHHPNPKSKFVLNYDCMFTFYVSFVSSLNFVSIPKSTGEVMIGPNWHQVMMEELSVLRSNKSWDIVSLSPNKTTAGCRWVYIVKVRPDGQIDCSKSCFAAKGYTQIFGLDYGDIFSLVAKINSIFLFLVMVGIYH